MKPEGCEGWKPVGCEDTKLGCEGWKPVGCEDTKLGCEGWNPVGCGCWKPVACGPRNGDWFCPWKGDVALEGRVGIKLLKPVCVGISGCSRLWLAGTGANGPRGPL